MTNKKEYNRIYKIGYDNARIELIKEFEKIINRISDLNFTKPIKKRLIEELNKLREK